MTLNRERWLVRYFFWSLGIVDEFADNGVEYRVMQSGTNLCFFFQTMVVCAPLILLGHVALIGLVLAAVFGAPIALWGFWAYVGFLVFATLFVLLILGVRWVFTAREAMRETSGPKPSKGPSATSLGWQWMLSQKRKVCPLISFTGRNV